MKKVDVKRIDSEFQIDSLKLRIPISECEILDQGLTGNLIIVNDKTGMVLDHIFKKNAYPINDNGINIYFAIEQQTTANQSRKEFLTMLVTSKLLKDKYFEGIRKDNITNIYDALMSYKVVFFSYESFLNSELTDVDFKKDISSTDINSIIKGCFGLTKEDHKYSEICKKYDTKTNKGIQWSRRETTETSTKPFIKIYHKGLDLLKSKSNEFYKNYLLGTPAENTVDNRIRIEFTIKNKKHFRNHKITSTKLKDILSLSSEIKNKMFIKSLSNHLDVYETKPITVKEELSPNHKIILKLMDIAVKTKKYVPDNLLTMLVCDIEDKSIRSRKKKELKLLFETRLRLSNLKNIEDAELRQEILNILLV
jgi:hypothetical protein